MSNCGEWWGRCAPSGRRADEEEAAGHAVEKDGHVLASERPGVRLDVLFSEKTLRGLDDELRHRAVVDRRAVDAPVIEARAHSGRLGRPAHDPLDLLGQRLPGLFREAADGALQRDRGGNDIEGRSAVDAADRHDGGVERRDLARDDRLQGVDDPGGRDDRIRGLVGRGAVSSAAQDLDGELVHRRQERAAVHADLSDGELVPEVEAEGGGDAFQHAVRRAGLRASASFLRGLEEEPKRRGRHVRRQTGGERECDRDVAVVAAGVHLSGRF